MSGPPDWTRYETWAIAGAHRSAGGGLLLESNLGTASLSAVGEGAFRLRFDDASDVPDYGILVSDAPAIDARAEVGDGYARIDTQVAGMRVAFGPPGEISVELDGAAVLEPPADAHFTGARRLPALARSNDGWLVSADLQSGEPVYGLGERWSMLNARGLLVDGWNRDALGVNTSAAYKHAPFAWSPRGWGVFVHTPARVVTGAGYGGWSNRTLAMRVDDRALDVFFLAGATPRDLIERYTAITGRTPAQPEWSLGVWMSRAYYRDGAHVLETARTIRSRGMPCDVITLDGRCWLDTGTRFAFEWDATRHPDPRALNDALHDLGFKVCVWEYPLISRAHPLHDEYARNGWLLTDPATGEPWRYAFDPEPFGEVLTPLPPSGLVDFTHPRAYADWRDRHAALFDAGVDVIKSDFGEQVPAACAAHNGDSGARLHNVYTLLYNRCVFEATEQAGKGSPALVFARSAWAGSQRYPAQWGGDPQADWGGLANSIRGSLAWGLSGGATYAHDIGGFYADRRDPELYVRWLQAAVFGSHCRFHGVGEREPWSYGEAVATIALTWLELRYRLIPYLRATLEQASESGMPVMRAMALCAPDDPLAWPFETQFMCGPDLLIVPVVEAGGRARGYLPRGNWHDFWTKQPVAGGRLIEQTCLLERIPVFVRDGAELLLGPAVIHTGRLNDANRIEQTLRFGAD